MAPSIPVPGPDGVRRVSAEDLSAEERSTVGHYFNAVKKVLSNEDPYAALDFEGTEIGGVPLPTDWRDIEDLAFAGEFDIDEFYSSEDPRWR